MSNTSFVRTQMVETKAPPSSQIGAVRWMRENLFSGPLNTILTVLSFLAVWWIVAHIGPWFANAVWNAGSLAECRQILDGATGACFAVIRDRWSQLLYGFYPSHLFWRPNLALVLMIVASAPVLF
ncbi:MAG: amino acid ABC transporter permease, partial [Gemmobacter sp.]